MVGINYTYWKQNPSLRENRIPIESYNFDPKGKPEPQMWLTVTSFGYGWFLAPYSFFTFFNLEANEITIRIFSLLWLAFTLLPIYLISKNLTKNLPGNSSVVYLTLIFYLFNSSVLWYHVQGYVHETAVLPFYFLNWFFFLRFIQTSHFKWLLALGICSFVSVQFDWLPCFQAAIMSTYMLMKRKSIRNNLAFVIPSLGILLGIAWIVYTYSTWATLPVYMEFLKDKFLSRTIGSGGLQIIPRLNYNFNIILFYLTGYGLLCVLFVWGLLKKKTPQVVWLIIFSAIAHHVVFWGFSTEHDHAVLKMAFPIAFISASVVSGFTGIKRITFAGLLVLVNIFIYFYLHNLYTRKGMYTNPNFCYEAGKYISENIKEKDKVVFINTQGKYLLQIEFYAGRPYTTASSLEEARQILHEKYPDKEGYFIDGEKEGIGKVIKFK